MRFSLSLSLLGEKNGDEESLMISRGWLTAEKRFFFLLSSFSRQTELCSPQHSSSSWAIHKYLDTQENVSMGWRIGRSFDLNVMEYFSFLSWSGVSVLFYSLSLSLVYYILPLLSLWRLFVGFVWLWCGPYVGCVCVCVCTHQHKGKERRKRKQMRGGSIQHVMKSAGCALPASQLKMNLDLWIWTSSSSPSESCCSDRKQQQKKKKKKTDGA